MQAFSLLFAVAALASLGVAYWLARRQIAHVRAHRDAVPPAFADAVGPAAHQRAADYTVARTRFGTVEAAVDTVLLLLLTLGGGLEFLARAVAVIPAGFGRELALVGSVVLLMAAVGLPFAWHRTFAIEARFGFNQMSRRLFIADTLKAALLIVVLGAPLLLAILWFVQVAGGWWWLYAWLAYCAFQILLLVLFPTVIMPMFNRFTPLPDGELKTAIEALLRRCGFAAGGLFVMDGSKRSRHSNAFFSGFGAAKRIVLFDTLIQKLSRAQIEAVLAHELGHFHHRHIVKRIAVSFLISLGFFALAGALMDRPWFHLGLGVSTASPAMHLVLLALALPPLTFLLTPLASRMSRRHEYEADAYAARQTSAADLIAALTRIYDDNAATLTPDPWHSAFYDSHPPALLRIGRLGGASA
ncbi:MAG: M48 family metallopeptidase [Burkholderiales bacterium]|nr:M48 family metallopeptidase [Burkholderiales bacterium]